MHASTHLAVAAVLSLLVSVAVGQTSTYSFCFLSQSLPSSPYGPWSVATTGTITVNSTAFLVTDISAANGGQRMAYTAMNVTGTRTQLNRDGSTSTAQVSSLCPTGAQGSDNRLFQTAPWTDWNGICFNVASSSNSPAGTTNWLVYPNDFPTQQIELYYDLPSYSYPIEYHSDNQTSATMSVVAGSTITCSPVAISAPLQTSLTYQFCYQAYAAASGSVPAWQVAIQGTLVTQSSLIISSISGQQGFYILSVAGTRYQNVGGGASTSVPVVGQSWHNSGGGAGNEFRDDPLLLQSAPHLSSRGFVLYTASQFTYPNGTTESIDNTYARVNAAPLVVSGNSVREGNTLPDWSQFALSCGSAAASCPLISNKASAAADTNLTATGACSSLTAAASSSSSSSTGAAGVAASSSSSSSPALPATGSSSSSSSASSSSSSPTPTPVVGVTSSSSSSSSSSTAGSTGVVSGLTPANSASSVRAGVAALLMVAAATGLLA